MSAYTPAPDDFDFALRNLNDLLNVICALQFDLDRDAKDPRVDSLLWIARDLSDGIVACRDEQSQKAMERR